MKKLYVLIVVVFIQGCMYQSVNHDDMEAATKMCTKYSSTVVEIRSHALGHEIVQCSDRKSYML